MASTCCQPIADCYPYKSTSELVIESSYTRREDNSSDDSNTPSSRSPASTEILDDDSAVAGDGNLEAEEGRSFVRHRPQENDTLSAETDRLQRAGQAELLVNVDRAG